MIKKFLLLVLTISLLITYVNAQTGFDENNPSAPYQNAITTAVPFLLISPDARSGGLGDQGVATTPDINSQAYNAAKYVFCPNMFGFSISYVPWLKGLVSDINLANLNIYYKPTEMDAIAFSLKYFSMGDIEMTDVYGSPIGNRKPNEYALDFSYSRKFIEQLSMSLTGRFIYSNLASNIEVGGNDMKAGMAGAADIGLFYQDNFKVSGLNNSTLRFGFSISNIGNKISYTDGNNSRDFLPTNLRLGLSYSLDFDEYNRLTLAGEMQKLLVPTSPVTLKDSLGNTVYNEAGDVVYYGNGINIDDISVFRGMIRSFYDAPGGFAEEMRELYGSFGVEYSYRDIFFARTGLFLENGYKGNRKHIQVGVGVKYNVFAIDVSYLFSFTQHHPLENSLRFTLSFDFASFNKETIKNQGRFN